MLVCVAGDADMEELPFLRRQGRSNKEIATDLHIELQTVKNHLRSLFTKAQHLRRTHAQSLTAAPSRPSRLIFIVNRRVALRPNLEQSRGVLVPFSR